MQEELADRAFRLRPDLAHGLQEGQTRPEAHRHRAQGIRDRFANRFPTSFPCSRGYREKRGHRAGRKRHAADDVGGKRPSCCEYQNGPADHDRQGGRRGCKVPSAPKHRDDVVDRLLDSANPKELASKRLQGRYAVSRKPCDPSTTSSPPFDARSGARLPRETISKRKSKGATGNKREQAAHEAKRSPCFHLSTSSSDATSLALSRRPQSGNAFQKPKPARSSRS